jgi:putative transcriptional regulator
MRNDLRPLRARHGLSQADLAARLGVSRQTVNAIETGRYDPSLPLAFKISEVFGLTIEELFFPVATSEAEPVKLRATGLVRHTSEDD